MTEEERHAAYLEAQGLACRWAKAAKGLDDAGLGANDAIDRANMWANVAQALKKDQA